MFFFFFFFFCSLSLEAHDTTPAKWPMTIPEGLGQKITGQKIACQAILANGNGAEDTIAFAVVEAKAEMITKRGGLFEECFCVGFSYEG